MVDTIIIGIEELLLFVPFSGSPVQIKGAGFMKFAKSLTSLACWLMAIVPGVYLLAYLSARYLHLPSAYYYPILALAAAGYAIFLFLVHRLIRRVYNSWHSREEEPAADCMNSDQ